MKVTLAAIECRKKILENGGMNWYPRDRYELSVGHIIDMCDRIVSEEISGEKAHRWLGWVQACMVFGEVSTLDELKDINKVSQ